MSARWAVTAEQVPHDVVSCYRCGASTADGYARRLLWGLKGERHRLSTTADLDRVTHWTCDRCFSAPRGGAR